MRKPNLRQIEAFKAVVECGSVSRAAEVLHVSQPAVSKLINHFEHTIGFVLFDRVKGRLVSTAEGRQLYEEIDRVFAGIEQITRAAEAIRSSRSGQIRIGVMPALTSGFVQAMTIPFLKARPDLRLALHANSSPVLANWLVNRQLDVAFPNATIDHVDVECEVLARNELVCLLPKGHNLARRKVLTPEDLAGLPFVSFGDTSLMAARVARAFAERKLTLQPQVTASNAAAVCGYVAAGVGFAVADPLHVAAYGADLALRPFEPAIENDLIMALARGRGSSALAQAFAVEVRRLVKSGTHAISLLQS